MTKLTYQKRLEKHLEEYKIRRLGMHASGKVAMFEAGLLDYMVAPAGQHFYSTSIPVSPNFRGRNEISDRSRRVSALELAA